MSPNEPVRLPRHSAPKASQLSSISQRSFFWQKSVTASKSNGWPSAWAATTALVFDDNALSNKSGRKLAVAGSTSINTGTNPFCTKGATVVGNPAATVITSSPGRKPSGRVELVKALTARRLALDPELVSSASRTPTALASSFSKASP